MKIENIKALFGTAWQEDAEIEFVELAKTGIPKGMLGHVNGNPSYAQAIADYLGRLFEQNKILLLARTSDKFTDLFYD